MRSSVPDSKQKPACALWKRFCAFAIARGVSQPVTPSGISRSSQASPQREPSFYISFPLPLPEVNEPAAEAVLPELDTQPTHISVEKPLKNWTTRKALCHTNTTFCEKPMALKLTCPCIFRTPSKARTHSISARTGKSIS